ncbi:hypothetical protein Bca52824_017797 [Brassica carinata]|uniref:Uncharacterized protein n=1 Tax=Brassica carinata TaxID=52824 RepID=A0A8X7VNU9_BRACI|nr:hypothetical protein Bca52824_017797 [Brassica carinata]
MMKQRMPEQIVKVIEMGKPKQKRGRKKGTPKVVQEQQGVEFVCTVQVRDKNVQDQEEHEDVEEQEEHVEEQVEPVAELVEPVAEQVEQEQTSDVPQQQIEDQHNSEDPEGEVELSTNEDVAAGSNRKRKRGPTKMKDLAKDPSTRSLWFWFS